MLSKSITKIPSVHLRWWKDNGMVVVRIYITPEDNFKCSVTHILHKNISPQEIVGSAK